VTTVTFFERTCFFAFLFERFVAVLAVLMVGILQLYDLYTVFLGVLADVMTCAAFVDMIKTSSITFPHVLAIRVHMVAVSAGYPIPFIFGWVCMLFVREEYGPFLVFLVAFIFDGNIIENNLFVARNKGAYRYKNQPGKNCRKENIESFGHLGFTSFLD
jgi:hypothetical protein